MLAVVAGSILAVTSNRRSQSNDSNRPWVEHGRAASVWALYTTRDGASHGEVDISRPYTTGQWHDLSISVDYNRSNPVLTWHIGGATVYSVIDTSGNQTDLPKNVLVGFCPGAWGNTAGRLTFDAVSLRD